MSFELVYFYFDFGFRRSEIDSSVYLKDEAMVSIYVDDILTFGPNKSTKPRLARYSFTCRLKNRECLLVEEADVLVLSLGWKGLFVANSESSGSAANWLWRPLSTKLLHTLQETRISYLSTSGAHGSGYTATWLWRAVFYTAERHTDFGV
ncbi:hypothetical protein BJ508DRAFT_314219 [Ascobolus immersus RN42]|uniref:Uncharacterized protein n=1 Tax=Ascobolus immersus RN42 TaxID=1160509 RepID=A0A3N4HFU6_ASCIM|nr:hypothetical protein BJ508DRAFT_314219 [Ascobolus immersus RN42]